MINAQEFLNTKFKKNKNLQNFYLFKMTKSLDKFFVIDLKNVSLKILPIKKMKEEIESFLFFLIDTKKEENDTLKNCFVEYLRYKRDSNYIRDLVWNFLYSLELMKNEIEEVYVFVNLLNFSINSVKILIKFFFWRKLLIETVNKDFVFIDELLVGHIDLNRILKTIFKEDFTKKIRLFQNIDTTIKGSSLLSIIMRDYINQEKIYKKIEDKNKIILDDYKNKNETKEKTNCDPLKEQLKNIKIKNNKTEVINRVISQRNSLEKTNQNNKKKAQVSYLKSAHKNQSKTVEKSNKPKRKVSLTFYNFNYLADKLKKEKKYLKKMNIETDQKMKRINDLNNDLEIEYEYLFNRGNQLYKAYLHISYKLKKICNQKFIRFPLSERTIQNMNEFSKYNPLINKS